MRNEISERVSVTWEMMAQNINVWKRVGEVYAQKRVEWDMTMYCSSVSSPELCNDKNL